jgi:hypothetical protein
MSAFGGKTDSVIDGVLPPIPDEPGAGFTYTDLAVKEWIGLVVYWFTGRTSALFPGP